MIGKTCVNGCVGGWWTDFWKGLNKAVSAGTMSASQLLSLYQQGQLTTEQYQELEKARIEASKTTATDKTGLYIGLGALALVGIVIFTSRK